MVAVPLEGNEEAAGRTGIATPAGLKRPLALLRLHAR